MLSQLSTRQLGQTVTSCPICLQQHSISDRNFTVLYDYGRHPNIDRDPKGIKPITERAHMTTTHLKELHGKLRTDLIFIAERMAKYANKKRSEGPDLKEGGMVYLIRKNVKTKRPSDKLDHTKLGPFKIKKNSDLLHSNWNYQKE